MMQQQPLSETDLQAYVDGHLNAARRSEVAQFLAEHPAEAERVLAYQEQNQLLHGLFDPVLQEPVPARLGTLHKPPSRASWARLAAMLAWAMVGGIGGYLLRGEVSAPVVAATPFAERAAVAHVLYTAEMLHPVEVGANQEAHLVQWLSKRLGHPLHTPDLSRFGYQLVGGRLLPGDKGAAAQFMYQKESGARLTLYVSLKDGQAGQTAFRIQNENGQPVMYWVDNNLGFALVGETDRQKMLDIARVAYQAMSL